MILELGMTDPAGNEMDAAQVAAAIHGLSQRERLVLALNYLEGFRVREIAALLELSKSRVYRLRSQALEKVRSELDGGIPLAA
jgi:RNA polymerase sigma factor (sigma-70 family)